MLDKGHMIVNVRRHWEPPGWPQIAAETMAAGYQGRAANKSVMGERMSSAKNKRDEKE